MQWTKQGDGSWKGSNGQSHYRMQFSNNRIDTIDHQGGNNYSLAQQDTRTGRTTKWNWDGQKGMWSRQSGRNGERTDMLPKDGSTITHDRLGRIQGLTGHGAIQNELNEIKNIQNPQLRNLRITQAYSDLSRVMNQMMPGGGANWPAYATWASRQAGVTMRGEDSGFLVSAMHGASGFARTCMGGLLGATLLPDPVQQLQNNAASAVGDGNKRVFSEIAPQLARFVSTFQGDNAPNQQKFNQYLQGFQGDADTQKYMKSAFTNYYNAMFNPAQRQTDVRQGNNAIAWIEQSHLQDAISAAIPPGMRDLSTRYIMRLNLPMQGGRQDISLADAGDWTNLNSRYNFIQNLMQQQQKNGLLYDQPFTTSTIWDMMHGRVPAGAP
ncbi:MAG: hypothetical protein ACYCW6_31510 [Candidatus Xenobia bacterium]